MKSLWKIAIIGSGPAGFYAAGEIFRQESWSISVDMFDMLPTPFGLVRGGVAPDHQKIKSVTKIFERIAEKENFRFFGNVEFGKDLNHSDILEFYDAVIYSVGSPNDRALGIPGEKLSGSYSATEFVAWYNGHPDFRDYKFNFKGKNAFVIGNGNVALDVARILAKTTKELAQTDIANYALDELSESHIENIWIVGRRGPLQAAFSPTELREFTELNDAKALVEAKELDLDDESLSIFELNASKDSKKNIEILKHISIKEVNTKKKKVHFLFLLSPTEIIGHNKVHKIRFERNKLVKNDDGSLRSQNTEKTIEYEADLIFRSIGYRGKPLPGLPFDQKSGTIPNYLGQVKDSGNLNSLRKREYVAGWIKRGPSGVIGTNKQDAVETVHRMFDTFLTNNMQPMKKTSMHEIVSLLKSRNVEFVSFAEWKILDNHEKEVGKIEGRPRVKETTVEKMLEIIRKKSKI